MAVKKAELVEMPTETEHRVILAAPGQELRVDAAGQPKFSPQIRVMKGKASRTVRTGQYESFAIEDEHEFIPDLRFSLVENTRRYNAMLTAAVNEQAEAIAKQFEASR